MDRAVIGLFFLFIFVPAVMAVISGDASGPQLTEKRRLTDRPALPGNAEALMMYPREYERYFDDHFPFRTQLIQGNNYLRVKILKQSDQRNVLMGRNGWLFYTREKVLKDFAGQAPFTVEHMERFRFMVESKRDWLAARGINYIFAIPPNKQTVYPEHMPENFYRVHGRTRMDQLIEYMQTHSDVVMVDLRSCLIAAKTMHQLYFRHDTHWNDIGALVGYGEIMHTVNRILGGSVGKIRMIDDFTVARSERKGGDLAHMLGLGAYFTEEDFILTPRRGPTCAKKVVLKDYPRPSWKLLQEQFAMECSTATATMVMFRDSFATRMVPYLAEHFRRSVFLREWNYKADFFKAVIEKEMPDIVIDECGERMLYYLETGPFHRPTG